MVAVKEIVVIVGVVLFVVMLTLAVALHEGGHAATARRFGMRVDRFFVGFGPTLWSWKRGETEYGLKAVPLGGFVRIVGMPGDSGPFLGAAADEAFPDSEPLEDPAARLSAVVQARGCDVTRARQLVEAAGLSSVMSPAQARDAVNVAIRDVVGDDGRVGSLSWRLLHGDAQRLFRERPRWQRALVLVAGPAANVAQAVVWTFVAMLLLGVPAGPPLVHHVEPMSAADRAGLRPGDAILTLDGNVAAFDEQLAVQVDELAGRSVPVEVRRDGVVLTVLADVTVDESGGGTLGIAHAPATSRTDLMAALSALVTGDYAVHTQIRSVVTGTIRAAADGVERLPAEVAGTQDRTPESLTGLIGMGRVTAEATASAGVALAFLFMSGLNLVLALMNLLPVPPLDGGHLAVLSVEGATNQVRRWLRPRAGAEFVVPEKVVGGVAATAVVCMLLLFATTAWLDVVNPIRLLQ